MNSLKAKKRSEIWEFFQPDEEHYAKCNICKAKCSYRTSTTNLTKHMQRRHPTVALPRTSKLNNNSRQQQNANTANPDNGLLESPIDLECVQQQETTDSNNVGILKNPKTYIQKNIPALMGSQKLSQKCKSNIDNQILKLFYCDYQPFRIVEDVGFKALVHALNPLYELPSRNTLSNTRIPALYEECRVKTKKFILEGLTFCVTTDCWTSKSNTSFLAVTAHFLSADFNLNSVLLQCSLASYSHTSIYLATELKRIVSDWGIENKISLAVSDNAANIKSAIINNLKWKHFGCLAHTINLIVKDGLKQSEVKVIIEKIKTIVTHFKRSSTSTAILMRQQQHSRGESLKLLQDVETRWNSTFHMLQRFLLLQDSIKSTTAVIESELPSLTAADWEVIKNLCIVLKPFDDATATVSSENYCTGSLVIPLVNGLINVFKTLFKREFPSCIQILLQKFHSSLHDRFENIEWSQSLQFATFLNPRFKNIAFADTSAAEKAKKICINATAALMQESSDEPQITQQITTSNDLCIWKSFDNIVSTSKPVGTSNSKAILEIQRYLEDEIVSRSSNPLQWWRNNKYKFPALSIVAQKKLCVLASSVPCERLFSKAGQILNDRRNSLSDNKLNMLVFLNCNHNLINE